jgi:type II secretory pathway component PulJ
MTLLAFLFTFALGASLGAAIMRTLSGATIADLRAENEELREAAALDQSLAKLKAIIEQPEPEEAA